MSEGMSAYCQMLIRMESAAKKYQHLPLKEFIKAVLTECNIDLKQMENVYIDEVVQLPFVWGCYKEDGKYCTYFTNERNVMFYEDFEDPVVFMNVFIRESRHYSKYK